MNHAIIGILQQERMGNAIGEFNNLIAGYETLDHYYLLTDLYLQKGDVASAQSTFNSIVSQFDLNPRRDQEYIDYDYCYNILFDAANNMNRTLTSSEVSDLEIIAEKHSNNAAGLALTMLIDFEEYVYHETLQIPANEKSLDRVKPQNPEWNIPTTAFTLFPNPTDSYFIVELTTKNMLAANVFVIDGLGRVLVQKTIDSNGSIVIDTRSLDNGLYQVVVKDKDGIVGSQKLEINR